MTSDPESPTSPVSGALNHAASSIGALAYRSTISGVAGLVGAIEALNTGIDAAIRCGDTQVIAVLDEARVKAALTLQKAAQNSTTS